MMLARRSPTNVPYSSGPSRGRLLLAVVAIAALALPTLAVAAARGGTASIWHEVPSTERDVVAIPSLAPLVDKVASAVLTITVEADTKNAGREPVLRGFGLEFRLPEMMPQSGQGTGFLIHESGYALTNNHVIENAGKISVTVGGRPEVYRATVVGTDVKTDVALIKLESEKNDWPFIPLGDSDALHVGDFVVAIGNPFGLSQTVSMGIISANHRREIAPSGRQGLYDFLQTDASINPGNSGGPLINLRGEVVGINAAVNTAGQGLGFAIPISLVKELIPSLKEHGGVERSWLGVGIRPVDPALAQSFGLDRPRGALVAQVVDDGPAAKAGIEPGDVITRFDGRVIERSSDLPLIAAHSGVGKKVPVELLREGKNKSLSVTLGAMPGDSGQPVLAKAKGSEGSVEAGKLGLQLQDLDATARQKLGLARGTSGALVVAVGPGTPAAQGGLAPGDVITKVNGRAVASARAFASASESVASGNALRLLVRRGTATIFVALKKP
jgi:serine protease Do